MTLERSILIQFARSFWICLVLFSVLVRAGREHLASSARLSVPVRTASQQQAEEHRSGQCQLWWGAERASPGAQQLEQRHQPEGSARRHSSTAGQLCSGSRRGAETQVWSAELHARTVLDELLHRRTAARRTPKRPRRRSRSARQGVHTHSDPTPKLSEVCMHACCAHF